MHSVEGFWLRSMLFKSFNWIPTHPFCLDLIATAVCIVLLCDMPAHSQSGVKLSNPILNNQSGVKSNLQSPRLSVPDNSTSNFSAPSQPNRSPLKDSHGSSKDSGSSRPVQRGFPQQNLAPQSRSKFNQNRQNSRPQSQFAPQQIPAQQRMAPQQQQTPQRQTPPRYPLNQKMPRFNVPSPRIPQANSPNPGTQQLPAQSRDSNQPEVIRERYENGKLRVERQVIQNQQRDYINHGFWKFYLPNGRVSAQAYFDHGKKSGAWSRWVTPKEVAAFRAPPFNQFKAPFLTTFHYDNDELNGVWKVADSADRKMLEFNLKAGKRHSTCTWYLPNGQKYQEINYRDGLIHGPYMRWNLQGQLVENRKFEQGQEIGHITEFHRPGVKKLEYGVLAGKVEAMTLDDPWNVVFATEEKIAPDIKHGPITAWYPNGQVRFSGHYKHDVQEGEFTWYYATGQKQAEGKLTDGQRAGSWIWWHENGMRASAGQYVAGSPDGDWQWWLASGKLSRAKNFGTISADSDDENTMKNASFKNQKQDQRP